MQIQLEREGLEIEITCQADALKLQVGQALIRISQDPRGYLELVNHGKGSLVLYPVGGKRLKLRATGSNLPPMRGELREAERAKGRLCTTREAAKILGVSARTIQKWCIAGVFDGAQKMGTGSKYCSWAIPWDSIRALAERREVDFEQGGLEGDWFCDHSPWDD